MSTDSFGYSEPQWQTIKQAVASLHLNADEVTLKRKDKGSRPSTTTLRLELEGAACVHLARSNILRRLLTPLRLRRFLTEKFQEVDTLRKELIGSHALRFNVGTHNGNPRLENDVDRVLSRVASQITGQIAAIGMPRRQSTKNATKRIRNLFWDDVITIWAEIGGKETGVHAAKFIMAVSVPVFARVHANAKDPVTVRDSIQRWLVRRRPKATK